MDVKQYLLDVQSVEVDDAAAKLYEPMIATMNAQIRDAAHQRLAFADEPGHYTALLREESRPDATSGSNDSPARSRDA